MVAISNTVDAMDLVGLFGAFLYLIAYAGVQVGLVDGNRVLYCILNGVAATCLLLSAFGTFSVASVVTNAMFLTFSLVGLWRNLAAADYVVVRMPRRQRRFGRRTVR